MSTVPAELLQILSRHQQTRLLSSLQLLSPADRAYLVTQLADVDFDLLRSTWQSARQDSTPTETADRAEQAEAPSR
ncbi:MAG: hypothetical protein ACK5EN_18580, partial [Planctomyces sp.]